MQEFYRNATCGTKPKDVLAVRHCLRRRLPRVVYAFSPIRGLRRQRPWKVTCDQSKDDTDDCAAVHNDMSMHDWQNRQLKSVLSLAVSQLWDRRLGGLRPYQPWVYVHYALGMPYICRPLHSPANLVLPRLNTSKRRGSGFVNSCQTLRDLQLLLPLSW
jgi:hypothetical protein